MLKQTLLQSLLVASAISALLSCQKETFQREEALQSSSAAKEETMKKNIFYGPAVRLGDGSVRTFFSMNPSGKPKELGVVMTSKALENLPSRGHHEFNYVLDLPNEAKQFTPYEHVFLNWNPEGHEPPHIYGVPHFDFHFYTITSAEREMIPVYDESTAALFNKPPGAGYLPANYVPTPGGVPQMGKHWIDPSSPEFHGQPFTYTFIYGTYNGEVIFSEPMITLSILQSKRSYRLDVPQPKYYNETNTYYPKDYNIYFDKSTQMHYITYSNFKKA